ncbi:MAG: TnpV protein [Eisenbergiella sp.]
MKSTFEKIGGTYTLGADGIYYPNLVSTDEELHYGKYGMMRKTYLKEHRPAMYPLYMLEDRLTEHLNAVDDETQERMDILVRQMMEKQGITEELKVRDQMEWVRVVNGIRSRAEEIVLKEFKVMESSFGSFSLIIENLKMIKCKVEVKLYER